MHVLIASFRAAAAGLVTCRIRAATRRAVSGYNAPKMAGLFHDPAGRTNSATPNRRGHSIAPDLPYAGQDRPVNQGSARRAFVRAVQGEFLSGVRMRKLFLPMALLLGACAPGFQEAAPSRAAVEPSISLPAMKFFTPAPAAAPVRSNQDVFRDFMDLTFQLESGRTLDTFSRFENPISVRVTGDPPPTLMPDLSRLIARLRDEAGIDIGRSKSGSATITIEAVSRQQISRFLPKAACFVVPNVSSLKEYRGARFYRRTDWSNLKQRTRIAIFVPSDSTPQEVRDCLHEELAQAIGPLNDLYRLPDSVFNDDNVHTVLTGLDMLILRAYYAPELRSGMSRNQVAERLPAILSRLNPDGDQIPPRRVGPTPREWTRAVQAALSPGPGPNQRLKAAQAALAIAQQEGWRDHRLGFSHFALGRLTQLSNPGFALQQFLAAERIYAQAPGAELYHANAAAQLAAYAINQGRGQAALSIIEPHMAIAARHENAALLATLMMLQAEALDLEGRIADAQTVRMDSLGWARYGFGADWAVRAKLREIAALSPRN